jgi:RHS repeat-associated protein
LSLGKLVSPQVATPDRGWFYRAPDGAEHDFLFQGSSVEALTYDGSFLRIKRYGSPVTHYEVEFGDGTIHKFNPAGDLVQIRDRVGHTIDVDYSDSMKWVITNRYNGGNAFRTTTIHFQNRTAVPGYTYANNPNFQKVIQYIDVPAFNGGTSRYELVYVDDLVRWDGCGDILWGDPTHIAVPLLTEIRLPDGSKYAFTFDPSPPTCAAGIVNAVKLPTMGSIEWTHGPYARSKGECDEEHGWVVDSPGVFQRTVKDAQGSIVGKWQYAPTINLNPGTLVMCGPNHVWGQWGPPPTEETTTVTALESGLTVVGKTKHYFSGARWLPPPGYSTQEYGLPFTRRVSHSSNSNRFLSTERRDASDVLVGSTYLTYKIDPPVFGHPGIVRPRVQGNLTVYDGDTECGGACRVDTERPEADYDGFGHYRKTITTSNFGPTRTTFTNFLPQTTPWILGTYDSSWVEEGGVASKQLFTFDANGVMRTRRTLVGSAPSAAAIVTDPKRDLLAVTCRDARGFPASERFFGGDASTALIPTGDPCTATPAATEFQINHSFTFNSSGAPTKHTATYPGMPFFIADEDLDVNTGLVSTLRDVSGISTAFTFDNLGRPKEVRPTGTAWTLHEYSNASGTTVPASIRFTTRPAGTTSSATPLTDDYVYYDGLGRLVQEKGLMPSDSGPRWSTTNGKYNLFNRRTSLSVPELRTSPSYETFTPARSTITSYDVLGRPIAITSPDLETTTIAYEGNGVREVRKTVEVALTTGPANVTTEETYDASGRLTQVKEANDTKTRYSNDLAGRVVKVCQNTTNEGVSCGQTRTFAYDNRGFLTSEAHPENGTASYTYDSRGHILTKTISGAPLAEGNANFIYDSAERLMEIQTHHPSQSSYRSGKIFTFGSANAGANMKKGKLETATRYNYNVGQLLVKESYDYSDSAGRLKKTTTEINKDGLLLQKLEQSQTYEAGGNPETITYPTCLTISCGAAAWNSTTSTFTNGMLTGVQGFADSISYVAAGAVSKVDHAGPVTDTYTPDETGVRPESIQFAGYLSCADTGPSAIAVSPDSGPSAGGTTVTLTGTCFSQGIQVQFNGAQASNVVVIDATHLTATTPGMPAGSLVPVSVNSQPTQLLYVSDFLDVPAGNVFHDDIETIFRRGVTAGCSAGNYCPTASVTRAQMAIFLLRAKLGSTYAPPTAQGIFSDVVVAGNFFAAWIEDLYNRGITTGCLTNPLRYCPSDPITHAQMAVFLLRAKEGSSYQPPPATGTVFADVPVDYPFAAWIEELARRGITSGCGGGNYCPTNPVLREQMARLLVRTFNLATQGPTLSAIRAPIQTHAMTWTSGEYKYDGAGNIATIGTVAVPGTQGFRTYGYDTVMRLTKAQISGVSSAATHEYGYDEYGNRTNYGVNGQWTTIPVSSTTNRLTNASYDASGNQTAQLATSATYDGFNMATSYRFDASNLETFVYTPNDERIGVLRGTDWTWSLRGADGKVLRQYRSSSTNPSAPWVWIEDFVYRGGLLLGSERVAGQGGRRHYHLDHLGSPRLVTGANGSVISEHDILPFGEERTTIGQHQARGYDREEPLRFTSHERDFDNAQPNDSSSYIDYMHARYYATKSGRFLSPDPVLGNLLEPQSWNRYAYVLNNPTNFVDPTGMLAQGSYGAGALRDGNPTCTENPDGTVTCSDTWTPEPPPPLPPPPELPLSDEVLRWMDERWYAVDDIRNPLTGMTVGETASAAANFAVGVGDGASFGIVAALRDDEDKQHIDMDSFSYTAGIWTGVAASSSAGSLRGAAYLTRFKAFRVINNNRYLRVGPSKWPRTQGRIPVLRIGTQRQATWNHWRLTVLGR